MGKIKDLSNQQFGLLKVICRTEDKSPGRPQWLCQCECGNQIIVSSTALTKTNGTKSCGCLRHHTPSNFSDLTGQKFGLLTVLHRDQKSTTKKTRWICQCECGNIVSVLGDSLRSHKTQSCGCSIRKLIYDLSGQRFGYLEVIEPIQNSRIKSNETRWRCLCHNCGRIVEVSSYWLRHSDPYGHCKCTRFEDRPE